MYAAIMAKKPKRPRDPNELAKFIVDVVAGEAELPEKQPDTSGKNAHAVALGREGGKMGGKVEAAKMTAAERKAFAQKMAAARWKNRDE